MNMDDVAVFQIYGVRAQHNNSSKPFYEMISERTNGAYIEFKNFNVISEMFLAGAYQFEQSCKGNKKYCTTVSIILCFSLLQSSEY